MPQPIQTVHRPRRFYRLRGYFFTPKPGSRSESEGYLVAIVNRLAESLSDLLIFDAERLDAGPLATAKLGIRLRGGLHGNWTPAHQLPTTPAKVA